MNKIYFFRKNILSCILLSVVLFFANSISAEESESAQNKTNSKQQDTKSPKPYTSKRARIKTLKEFVPSEEVSADKPVAFPSDI